jgi:signal peptidase I
MNWKFWKKDSNSAPKSKTREWADAIVFAVVAATIIRTFFFEAFTIPTPVSYTHLTLPTN